MKKDIFAKATSHMKLQESVDHLNTLWWLKNGHARNEGSTNTEAVFFPPYRENLRGKKLSDPQTMSFYGLRTTYQMKILTP